MKASRAGTERYICKRSILADLQLTLIQRCHAGVMSALQQVEASVAAARAYLNGQSRTITEARHARGASLSKSRSNPLLEYLRDLHFCAKICFYRLRF